MIDLLWKYDGLKLLSNFLLNVSSAYFMVATITPTSVSFNFSWVIINFSFNLSYAIIFFVLAIKINNIYE